MRVRRCAPPGSRQSSTAAKTAQKSSTAIQKSPGSESLATLLGSAIVKRSDVESQQLWLENSVAGRVLDAPKRSRETIGMSGGFKLAVVCFVALMASFFVSILAHRLANTQPCHGGSPLSAFNLTARDILCMPIGSSQ